MARRTKRKGKARKGAAPTAATPRWYASPLLLGVLGTVVAVASFVLGKAAFEQDSRALDVSLTSRVDLVTYEASTVGDIPMEVFNADRHQGTSTTNAAAVDVVVENLHDQPGLITRIDVEMKAVHRIAQCGGGPLNATARYDIAVPLDADPAGRTFSLDRLHKVPGKDKDRFAVTVGPDRVHESDLVQIFHFDLVLVLHSGGSLRADDIMLISPPGDAQDNDRIVTALTGPGARECLFEARHQLDEAMRAQVEKRSPRIAELHAKLHAAGR